MTTDGTTQRDDAVTVQSEVKAAGSSFYWAMRLLPPDRREAMFAIYSLCRELDDIADGDEAAESKLDRLGAWREAIKTLPIGVSASPVVRSLSRATIRHNLPSVEFEELIKGMETDARGSVCAPSMKELMGYCRQVAGSVGLLSIAVFGRSDPAAQRFAIKLGEALQLTNILRDIEEDAGRGRLYLPEECLHDAGVVGRAPLTVIKDPHLPKACEAIAALAESR
ncbi:MAG: squalene/phytoene synthase family protein, partial [Rhodospirillales bacterium]|nr:squalene/phytoene synthase family protein [Rhodospirillales bacterium]